MNKIIKLYILATIIFFLQEKILFAINEPETSISPSKITVAGFKSDETTKKHLLYILSLYNFYDTGKPVNSKLWLKFEDGAVLLRINNYKRNLSLYAKKIQLKNNSQEIVNEAINKLIKDFSNKMKGTKEKPAEKDYAVDDVQEKPTKKFDRKYSGNTQQTFLRTYIGLSSGSHSNHLKKESSDDLSRPDQDKKLTYESTIPYFGLLFMSPFRVGSAFDLQYRKVSLITQDGSKTKANILFADINLMYAFPFSMSKESGFIAPTIGYFVYNNTVTLPLIRYVSTKYSGPYIGFFLRSVKNEHGGLFNIKYSPTLTISEDQIQRGTKGSGTYFYADAGYEFTDRTNLGCTLLVYYRHIQTKFSGTTSYALIKEDQEYVETHFGFKLLFSYLFDL